MWDARLLTPSSHSRNLLALQRGVRHSTLHRNQSSSPKQKPSCHRGNLLPPRGHAAAATSDAANSADAAMLQLHPIRLHLMTRSACTSDGTPPSATPPPSPTLRRASTCAPAWRNPSGASRPRRSPLPPPANASFVWPRRSSSPSLSTSRPSPPRQMSQGTDLLHFRLPCPCSNRFDSDESSCSGLLAIATTGSIYLLWTPRKARGLIHPCTKTYCVMCLLPHIDAF